MGSTCGLSMPSTSSATEQAHLAATTSTNCSLTAAWHRAPARQRSPLFSSTQASGKCAVGLAAATTAQRYMRVACRFPSHQTCRIPRAGNSTSAGLRVGSLVSLINDCSCKHHPQPLTTTPGSAPDRASVWIDCSETVRPMMCAPPRESLVLPE